MGKLLSMKNITLVILVGCFLLCLCIGTEDLRIPIIYGTYYSENDNMQYIAIDTYRENVFYYTDLENQVYIAGTIKKQEDNTYSLVCNQEKDRAYFPEQLLEVCDNKTITLIVNHETISFEWQYDILNVSGHNVDGL